MEGVANIAGIWTQFKLTTQKKRNLLEKRFSKIYEYFFTAMTLGILKDKYYVYQLK